MLTHLQIEMPHRSLQRIQALVRELQYEVTDHAWDELASDNLLLIDIETAISNR